METYLADKADRPSRERMEFAWMRLKAHFGHLRPEQITRESCRAYIGTRRKAKISDGTIRKELTTLRAAVNHSSKSSGAVFVLPPAPAPKERHLTRKEYGALMDAAKANHLRLFIALALATAGRKEAILDLTWDRVNFETGRINLGRGNRQKGRAAMNMGEELRAWLLEAYEARSSDYVIEWAGDRVKNIRKGFDTACTLAKLRNVTPHTLRHTAAVWMAEDGRPMSEIAQVLGHSDSRTTERVYARFSPDYLVKTTAVLDSALSRK
jgi:integrase